MTPNTQLTHMAVLKSICFYKNTLGNMTTEIKRLSHVIQCKLEVLEYIKMHGNRAAERHF